jgi:hypothetical protein
VEGFEEGEELARLDFHGEGCAHPDQVALDVAGASCRYGEVGRLGASRRCGAGPGAKGRSPRLSNPGRVCWRAGLLLVRGHLRPAQPESPTKGSPGSSPDRARQVLDEITRSELRGSAGVVGLIARRKPVINTDHNGYIEYDTPRYSSSERDRQAHNIAFLRAWNR